LAGQGVDPGLGGGGRGLRLLTELGRLGLETLVLPLSQRGLELLQRLHVIGAELLTLPRRLLSFALQDLLEVGDPVL
jgi:hypothetical protein